LREINQRKEDEQREKELVELEKLVGQQESRAGNDLPDYLTKVNLSSNVYQQSHLSTALPRPSPASITETASPAIARPTSANLTEQAASRSLSSLPSTLIPSQGSETSMPTEANDVLSATPKHNSNITTVSSISSSSTYSRAAPPRSDSSKFIHAFIIRRLDALEGNSSLVARYIEEQNKAMRHMLGRVESRWDEWRIDSETEEGKMGAGSE